MYCDRNTCEINCVNSGPSDQLDTKKNLKSTKEMMIMKCPYYNEEMKTGYIQCRDGVYWSEKKRMVSALPPMKGEDVDLREICEGSYKSYAIAYDCSKCKK